MSKTYVVKAVEPDPELGLTTTTRIPGPEIWRAGCCDERRGCCWGDDIGDYPTKAKAEAAARAHRQWHATLDLADQQEQLEAIARLVKSGNWRHSEMCEQYAKHSVKDCICGLLEWQTFYRNRRPKLT